MIAALILALPLAPSPVPSPTGPPIDANRVTPGALGFLSFLFLVIVVIVIYFSLRKQLSRINFDEDAPLPAGVRPVPPYATRDARRAAAKGRAGQATSDQVGSDPTPDAAAPGATDGAADST